MASNRKTNDIRFGAQFAKYTINLTNAGGRVKETLARANHVDDSWGNVSR